MIWIRAGLLALAVGVLVLAVTARRSAPPPVAAQAPPPDATPVPEATPLPTRVPLPTTPPQMIVSRVARETPVPRATATPLAQPRVSIVDNGYLPAQLTVPVGASVAWVNFGSDGHDVTGNGPGGAWHSGPLGPAERFQRSFALPGTYDYTCSVHPEMRGRIVVVQP